MLAVTKSSTASKKHTKSTIAFKTIIITTLLRRDNPPPVVVFRCPNAEKGSFCRSFQLAIRTLLYLKRMAITLDENSADNFHTHYYNSLVLLIKTDNPRTVINHNMVTMVELPRNRKEGRRTLAMIDRWEEED